MIKETTSIPTKTWPEVCRWLGFMMADRFRESNMAFTSCMVEGKSISAILNHCYSCLHRKKIVTEIENLPTSEKNRLFLIIKDFAPDGYTKEQFIHACKALYALEYYLNTQE